MDLVATFGSERPVIGMVHLPPLPGAPRFDGDRDGIRTRALRDAEALAAGGVDAVMVENFGDAPYYPEDVPEHTVASMTALVDAVGRAVDCPVGVNVLRNDAAAAVSIAAATGATFVRVNVHAGARVTDQGVIEGRAHETLRLRDRLDADVAVLADLDVKHSVPLSGGGADLADLVERGLADGVVVTDERTGDAVAGGALEAAAARRTEAGLDVPLFVGSGVTPETVAGLLDTADGVVVGTALKEGGDVGNPIDEDRVAALVAAAAE